MKRDPAAILGLLKREGPDAAGATRKMRSPGGPDAAGAKRTKSLGSEAPPSSQVSSAAGRRLRSRSFSGRLHRSFQTDAQAEPARPDVGTASGASVASLERSRAAAALEVVLRSARPVVSDGRAG